MRFVNSSAYKQKFAPRGMIRPLMTADTLTAWAAGKGYDIAWGPGNLLGEVRAEIVGRSSRGEIDSECVEKWLGWVRNPCAAEDTPGTVIAVAVPCAACSVRFTQGARVVTATVPPTYVEDAYDNEAIRQELKGLLPELGDLELIGPARKALAVRLGLTAYGLNNITYSATRGSYVLIVALATSARLGPWPGSKTRRPEVLAECESCGRCRDACPTSAISQDRFLLRAERCLTCWNELPGRLPSWFPADAHNCLIGCMVCQEVCPLNQGLLKTRDSGILFDQKETAALRAGEMEMTPALNDSIQAKLNTIGLPGIRAVVGRNLALLIRG
jgi:epoxyqueuosine reductase